MAEKTDSGEKKGKKKIIYCSHQESETEILFATVALPPSSHIVIRIIIIYLSAS